MRAAVHARQVHGRTVRHHREMAPGLHLVADCDGHVTRAPGVLLAVAVADCVPIFLVAPRARAVGVVHAGWRGVAAGVVEAGLDALKQRLDVAAVDVEAHLGPAICGGCYEVGPEVHRGLGLPDPGRAATVDLRGAVAGRLRRRGVPAAKISTSSWCTRCGDSPFFSHRGGDPHRQVAFVGVAG
jgi:YfiH family protein